MRNAHVLVLICALSASCASYSFDGVDNDVINARYDTAFAKLEKEKKHAYGSDAVRYNLDTGMIAHFGGRYKDSTERLLNGDRAIEAAWTKSISQYTSSYITNDTAIEYAGEDYENIYLNLFNALNYYHLENIEDALVEIRRMEEKLRNLSQRYNTMETELTKKDGEAAKKANVKINFSNSALARYLSILFYRVNKNYDDARIDRDWLKRAFSDQKNIYNFSIPKNIDDELDVPDEKARLNVIAFAGLSPIKEEVVTRVPVIIAAGWIKIALPRMRLRGSKVSAVDIVFDSGKTFKLELIESIERTAEETFKKHLGIIEAKSIIRATVKGGTAAGLMTAGDASNNSGLFLLGLATQIFAEASERADLRIARYFPARSYIGGINLSPGTYSFTVRYLNSAGAVIAAFPYKDVSLKAGELNLFETVFLK